MAQDHVGTDLLLQSIESENAFEAEGPALPLRLQGELLLFRNE